MTAGRRDHLITFQTYTSTQDDYGEETPNWSTAGQEWAAVFYGRGDERRQAAMEQGSQAATFKVLDNAVTRAMTVAGRIVHDGANWDIVGIAPDMPKRGLREFTAVRAT
jgi:SPP1 family predicted phage head-tail adaptor